MDVNSQGTGQGWISDENSVKLPSKDVTDWFPLNHVSENRFHALPLLFPLTELLNLSGLYMNIIASKMLPGDHW